MGTRRWVGALEAWLSNTDWTKDKLAERSQHSAAHVREMFERADPNPTLRLYLELVQLSGARFQGVTTNEPVEVIKRIKEILVRENIATVSALAKVAQINRSQLSTLFNDPDPNPTLATFDRLVVALGAEQEFTLVSFIDNAVAQVIAVGVAEVQAVKQAPPIRHLHAVPEPASVFTALRRQFREAEADVAAAARALDGKKTVVSYNATTFYDRGRRPHGSSAWASASRSARRWRWPGVRGRSGRAGGRGGA